MVVALIKVLNLSGLILHFWSGKEDTLYTHYHLNSFFLPLLLLTIVSHWDTMAYLISVEFTLSP